MAAFAVLAALSLSCDSQRCPPGKQASCVCPGGANGIQACKPDGSGFLECDCSAASSAATAQTPAAIKEASVVPMPGNTVAPVRDAPGFEGSKIVQQLKPGTRVEAGEKKVTPGKKTPDIWHQVRVPGNTAPLGWMHDDVLILAEGSAIPCTRCAAEDGFCAKYCKQSPP